jgi:hypothetical protein
MQTALWPVRLKETRVITELTVGVFQTVGVPTDGDYFFFYGSCRFSFLFLSSGRSIAETS